MKTEDKSAVLNLLDRERQTIVYPGVTRFSDAGVVREISADGKRCEIVYSSCTQDQIDQIIKCQIQTARTARYELEWKVYEHDRPDCLGARLAATGFTAGEREAFMVLRADSKSLDSFGGSAGDIRRVTAKDGMDDYRIILEEVRGRRCEKEIEQYAFMLKHHPNNMSIYVAYVDEEPAACGRVYFHPSSQFAALYGGNTRERFRKRGLFTQVVAARIGEALSRGIVVVCVDALPTSEPILKKRGFESVTHTQPFRLLEEKSAQR